MASSLSEFVHDLLKALTRDELQGFDLIARHPFLEQSGNVLLGKNMASGLA
jgi:hypothetical protein